MSPISFYVNCGDLFSADQQQQQLNCNEKKYKRKKEEKFKSNLEKIRDKRSSWNLFHIISVAWTIRKWLINGGLLTDSIPMNWMMVIFNFDCRLQFIFAFSMTAFKEPKMGPNDYPVWAIQIGNRLSSFQWTWNNVN